MGTSSKLRRDALAIYRAALKAANARDAVTAALAKNCGDWKAAKRVFVLAVGKAAPDMARAIETQMGKRVVRGLIVTKHGHATTYKGRFRVVEAGHPIPDEAGVAGAQAAAQMVRGLAASDLLVLAVSGGASALLCAPVEGIELAAKQATTNLLLKAGADIFELNCVRKHLSMLKGGKLAALVQPARVLALLLSDVVGDPPDVIGSGLTAPDPTTFQQAIDVLRRRQVWNTVPAEVRKHLTQAANENPKPNDPVFKNVNNVVVGSNRLALEAARNEAKGRGYRTVILSSRIQGEARSAGEFHASVLLETLASGNPAKPPVCVLSGGETTVQVRGAGKGGRNQEFALAVAMAIRGAKNAVVLAAGTDGSDGPTDAAGAIVSGDTITRAEQAGLSAKDHMARNDSYCFFEALGDLVKTGPTGTNVMDVSVMLAG